MGYKDKKYQKDLHQQAYEKLTRMQAFGESKAMAMRDGTAKNKIFSAKTYKVYWEHTKKFVKYVNERYPECKSLKKARKYVPEYLRKQESRGLSAWTIQTEAKSLGKLFGITPEDPDYYKPPTRLRENITRSRLKRSRDKHFSLSNNDELIRFCKGVGARREGLTNMRGRDLRTREQIEKDVDRLTAISRIRNLTSEEKKDLRINKDSLMFSGCEYFLYLREKGGRERISPIIGPDTDAIVSRIKNTPSDEKVWQHIHSAADIHGYRSDYANRIYKLYARPIEEIPYDRTHAATGQRYQSEVYHCRKDLKGISLDRKAMLLCSRGLGHNRIDVVGSNYLRGL